MYKNILLPTDGLGKCAYGTCHGILLAKELNAKITAVHVTGKLSAREILNIYQPATLTGSSGGKKAQEDMAQVEEARKELGAKALESAERMCTEVGVACETVQITEKSPEEGILKVAREKGCDLIFISTHGNPGVMGSLFGTLATKVMAQSKYAVLTHYCGGPS
ncbi:MAG: universal stress protein [Candidatus Deferrimicrobiaceae bacterium]